MAPAAASSALRSLRTFLIPGLAASLSLSACSDLALEPDRVPSEMTLEPFDTLITRGDQARFRVTVLDQDGRPFDGLPSWAPPEWIASDPEALRIAPDGAIEALGGGEVRVEARLAGLKAWTKIRVNPDEVVLSAPVVYLAQAVQNLQGSVPLVAGRDALMRVFTTSEPASFYQPTARASFYMGDSLTYQAALRPGSYMLPSGVEERRMDRSFNALIPGEVLQPGVQLVVELDEEGSVPLAPGSRGRVPEEGRMALDVREVPPMELTVVPTLLASDPDPSIFNWTGSLSETSSTVRYTRSVLPIGALEVQVREAYTTSADLTTDAGWSQFLREMAALRVADGATGYYYGAVVLPPGSKWGGLGYVGAPTAVGRPTESTLAHELGHNLSLRHAPCGGVDSFDRSYPYSGGVIGVWGYSNLGGSGLATLQDPGQVKDLMGYCSPRWISDYHFTKALNFRIEDEAAARTAESEATLLLWGGVEGGSLRLEPAFALEAPPVVPMEPGPYRLVGVGGDGRRLFALRFSVTPTSRGSGHFTFAVPLAPEDAAQLASITFSGPEGATSLERGAEGPAVGLVRDAVTGRVRAFVRGAQVPPVRTEGSVVTWSTGLPAEVRR